MIPFTQFLRPNGVQRPGGFTRPPEVEAMAQRWLDAGGKFSAEVLPGGSVALTAEWQQDGEWEDAVILLAPNDPRIGGVVDTLVLRAVGKLENKG